MKRLETLVPRARAVWLRGWPLLLLALLCVAFYWDALWLPADRILGGNDLSNMFFHWLGFVRSSISEGRLPLWNPYLFSGQPFVANPQPALFYPPTWLSLVMPVTRAMALTIVLHIWLAGAGTFAWLRSEGASVMGALFGAVVFSFSGYFFVRVQAGHIGVITTGAWLPTILWLYRCAFRRRSWTLAVVTGLPVALSFLAGHTASFVYVLIGLGTYALFTAYRQWREQRRLQAFATPLGLSAAMVVAGLALAAVQLLPMAELAAYSTRRAGLGYDFAARFSWPPGYLLTLLVPNFFGEPVRTGYWGDGAYDEAVFYVGVLPLVLALLGLRLRHRLRPFLLAVGVGALLLAFGQYGALHPVFYRWLPLYSLTRAPSRAGFLFVLAASASAGLALTHLQGTDDDQRHRLLKPVGTPLVLTVALGATLVIAAGFGAFALQRETNPAAGRLWHVANRAAAFLFLFLLAAGLLVAWRRAQGGRATLPWLALGLVLVDLWAFGGEVVRVVDVEESSYWRAVSQAVSDPDEWRVLPWGLNDFGQNGGMPYGLRSVFGYDPLLLQRYEDFITSQPDHQARTYDLLNARYLVSPGPQEISDSPKSLRLVLEEGGIWIYERPTAMERAWIVHHLETLQGEAALARIHDGGFDPRNTALVEELVDCESTGETGRVVHVVDEGNRIEAHTEGGGGLLILSEVDYPGWRATVDGVRVPIVRADYLLRALCVPPGEHDVELIYDPPLLKVGLAISATALLTIFGLAVGAIRRRRNEA